MALIEFIAVLFLNCIEQCELDERKCAREHARPFLHARTQTIPCGLFVFFFFFVLLFFDYDDYFHLFASILLDVCWNCNYIFCSFYRGGLEKEKHFFSILYMLLYIYEEMLRTFIKSKTWLSHKDVYFYSIGITK